MTTSGPRGPAPVVVGAIPGPRGAIAVLRREGSLVGLHDMPGRLVTQNRREVDLVVLARLLRAIAPERVLLGRQSARPGDGVAAAFAAGRWFGELLGVCDALELSHTDVLETSWRRILGVGDADPRARACCAWPAAAGDLALVTHRCRAAALFIAELCRRRTYLADRVPLRRVQDDDSAC
jgi:hypothetical protein